MRTGARLEEHVAEDRALEDARDTIARCVGAHLVGDGENPFDVGPFELVHGQDVRTDEFRLFPSIVALALPDSSGRARGRAASGPARLRARRACARPSRPDVTGALQPMSETTQENEDPKLEGSRFPGAAPSVP